MKIDYPKEIKEIFEGIANNKGVSKCCAELISVNSRTVSYHLALIFDNKIGALGVFIPTVLWDVKGKNEEE